MNIINLESPFQHEKGKRTRTVTTSRPNGSQSISTVRVSNSVTQSISKRRNKQSPISEALAQWLRSYKWSHWSTFTFRQEITPISARRCFERFLSQNRRFIKCAYFCIEYGEAFGRTHLHALLYFENFDTVTTVWEKWFIKYGRNEIRSFKENEDGDAVNYVSNYLLKGTVDWDIFSTPIKKV